MEQEPIYTDFGFAIIRAPLFPFFVLDGKKKNLFLEKKWDLPRLMQACNTPLFAEALFVSSPELYAEFKKILEEGLTAENRGAALKVASYFFRMSSRPTPFGLSAGIAAVQLKSRTDISLSSPDRNKKKVCINFDAINTSLDGVLKDTGFLKQLSFFSSNTVYKNEKGLHFLRINRVPHGRSTIVASPLIEQVLAFCTRPVSWQQICAYLMEAFQCTEDLAEKFLLKMVGMELLLPDCYPDLFSKDENKSLGLLSRHTAADHMNLLAKQASLYEQAPVGEGLSVLEDLAARQQGTADELHVLAGLGLSGNSLNRQITEEMSNVLHFLIRFRGVRGGGTLKKFSREFERRYGDRAVPLCEALDERTGIGYPFLPKPYISSQLTNELLACDFEEFEQDKAWDAFLMSLLSRVTESGTASEIRLREDDLTRFNSGLKDDALPESLYSIFSILATDQKQLDEGNFLVDFAFAGGPSCASAINRFSGLDNEIDKHLDACMRWENDYHEQRGRCLAELNFLPRQGIGGNILMRGHSRKYEIPVLTAPTPGKHHFNVNQILLQVKDGRIRATDKLSGKEILPVATVLYDNHNTASASYNSFLTDLGHIDKIYNLEWGWGSLETWMDHFPRVRFGKTILSREKWVIRQAELGQEPSRWADELKRVIRLRKIPSAVYYAEKTDNLLFLQLDNEVCLEIVIQKLRKYGKVVFTEVLQQKENTWLPGESGAYVHEFVLPVRLSAQMIEQKENPVKKHSVSTSQFLAVGCNVLLMEELLAGLFEVFEERPDLGKLIHYFKEVSPSELLLEIENPAADLIEVLQQQFGPYMENNHVYYLKWKGETDGIPLSPDERHAQLQLAKAALAFWGQNGLSNNFDTRFTAYLTASVHLFEKMFKDKARGVAVLDELLERRLHLVLQKGIHVNKTELAACYRNIISEISGRYTTEIEPLKNLFREQELAFRMPATEEDPAAAFASMLELIGNKFLFCSPNIREQIIVLDFIKQYYKNRKFLLQYKGVDLMPLQLTSGQPA